MIFFSLFFLFGDWLLQQQRVLPAWSMLILLFFLALLICSISKNRIVWLCVLGALCGFSYAAIYADHILRERISHDLEGKLLLVEGYIASIPVRLYESQSFRFKISKLTYQQQVYSYQPTVTLYFKTDKHLLIGDKWQCHVRLKRVHATQNPGAHDYESYALQNHITAMGSVQDPLSCKKISTDYFYAPLQRFRQILYEHLNKQLPETSSVKHWLIALMMGERIEVPSHDWEILRRTGTNHLMVIGGLHIGIITGFVYAIACFLLRKIPTLIARIPLQYLAACIACGIGVLYAAIAGFSIPTQRAAIMLVIATIYVVKKQRQTPWHALSLAMLIVLLFNPLVILSESFWLSFSTIAWIFYCMSGRLAMRGFWWQHGRIQWIIGIGLIPLSLYFFQECSLMGFIANSIAIPWLAFLLLPWLLVSCVFSFIAPFFAHYLFYYCDLSLSLLWRLLTWLSQLPLSSILYVMPHQVALFTTSIACLIFLMPRGFKGRYLALIWLLPLFSGSTAKPARQAVWLTLLDVGQGLAVVVQTTTHAMVYDAGPRYATHDSGESVIIPYLKHQQIRTLDMLMISHGDNDHIGGAKSILTAFNVAAVKTSVPEKINFKQTKLCLERQSWRWDGVVFTVLHPSASDLHLGNDSSCVLMIDNGALRILLTGDLEVYGENVLLQKAHDLRADILIAPHHGSKTSSSAQFVENVAPKYVLYAVGYRNRYHFPHQAVVRRYDEMKASSFSTDSHGAIQFKLNRNGLVEINAYRDRNKRYWHDS